MEINRDDILKGLSNIGFEEDTEFWEGTFDRERMGILKNLVGWKLKPSKSFYMRENSSDICYYINKLTKYQTFWDLDHIGEGEVIYAMYLAGFDIKRVGKRAYFKITSYSCHKLFSEANTEEHNYYSGRSAK